jgi:hypothetical protein
MNSGHVTSINICKVTNTFYALCLFLPFTAKIVDRYKFYLNMLQKRTLYWDQTSILTFYLFSILDMRHIKHQTIIN